MFNLVVEEKLDLILDVKFNGESDGDSFEAQKPYLDPHMDFIDP